MRKLLIRLFVLDYIIGSSRLTRASVIIYPMFILSGIATYYSPDVWAWYKITAYIVTVLSLYFGFIHFEIFKVERNELSGSQLKQWDEFYNK